MVMEDLSEKGGRRPRTREERAHARQRVIFGDPASVIVSPTDARLTQECFHRFCQKHRNADVDRWLPEEQRAVGTTEVLVFPVVRGTMAKEWGARLCGLDTTATEQEIGISILEKAATLTLPQVKETVTSQILAGAADNGFGNFFFLAGKAKGAVYGGVVLYRGGGWRFDVFPLTYGAVWAAGVRVLIPAWNVSTRTR